MSALIEIKKELIGTENINSVNSRELWNNLEVKKPFSDWIKFQINSLNLEQNIDYILVSQKSEAKGRGGNRKETFDYIITLDTAKHIAMASRTEKGKEVRKYFIEAEKKLNQLQPQEQNILPVLVEMAKVNQMLVQSNQEIVANLTNMNAGLHEMLATMHNIKHDTSRIKEDMKVVNGGLAINATQVNQLKHKIHALSPALLDKIRDTIEVRANELSDGTKTNIQSITRAIYSYINNEFDVSSYYYLTEEQTWKALAIIKNINIGVQNA